MGLLIPFSVLTVVIALHRYRRHTKDLHRERELARTEIGVFAKMYADPLGSQGLTYSGPVVGADKRNSEIFSVWYGPDHRMGVILDTSRRKARWWVLTELFTAGDSRRPQERNRVRRAVVTLTEDDPLAKDIYAFYQWASRIEDRGRPVASADLLSGKAPFNTAPALPPDPPVDPFEPLPAAPSAPAVPVLSSAAPARQSLGDGGSATGD